MLEFNKIYRGDCLELMVRIKEKSVNMVLCDLPYGQTQNEWDSIIPLDKLWNQYKRIIKDRGIIVLTSQGMFTANLMKSSLVKWRYNLIWNKKLPTGFLNANRMPLRVHEDILVFYNNLPTYNPIKHKGYENHGKGQRKGNTNRNYGKYENLPKNENLGNMKFPISIITLKKTHPSMSLHPTEKPVELFRYLIKTFTNEGDLVLDNCGGSGTTAVACKQTNRNFILIEKEQKYVDIANKRLEQGNLNTLFQNKKNEVSKNE